MVTLASSRKYILGSVVFLCCFFVQFGSISSVSAVDCVPMPDGCCKTVINPGEMDASGVLKGKVEKKTCPSGEETYFADCVCQTLEAGVAIIKTGESYAACDKRCLDFGATMASQGIGLFKPKGYTASAPVAAEASENSFCFTKKQCQDANGDPTAFVASEDCTGGMGQCRAPESDIGLSTPIGGVTSVKNIRTYIQAVFQFSLTVVGIVAAIMLIWGAFRYVIGSSAGDVTTSKKTMQDALIGMILVFTAYTLLNTLNPATLRFDKLDIFMENKVLYSTPTFCQDYKPAPGKELKFAEAGTAPGPGVSIMLERAVFNKKADEPQCGMMYYPFGFGNSTCLGRKCPNPAMGCAVCKGVPKCVSGDVKAAEAVCNATFTPTI